MAGMFARRCGRPYEEVSRAEKAIGAVILFVLAAVGGAAVYALTVRTDGEKVVTIAAVTDKTARPAVDRPTDGPKTFDLPKVATEGWTGPEQVQAFTPESVHQKINGRDGLYLAYGIASLTFGSYKRTGQDDRYVDAYVYDMGSPFNAFGCYKAEYAEGMPAIPIGRGGYRAERSVFFWKGAYYVQLVAGDGVTKDDDSMVEDLGRQIAGRIPDDGTPLWGDGVLPKVNRKPDGLGYERINAFSLDFLKDIFRANYVEGQSQYAMFIHRADSPEAARQVFDRYAEYLGKHGKMLARQDSPGGQTLVGEATGMFDVVFCKDRYVGGVNGAEDRKLAEARATAFRDALK